MTLAEMFQALMSDPGSAHAPFHSTRPVDYFRQHLSDLVLDMQEAVGQEAASMFFTGVELGFMTVHKFGMPEDLAEVFGTLAESLTRENGGSNGATETGVE